MNSLQLCQALLIYKMSLREGLVKIRMNFHTDELDSFSQTVLFDVIVWTILLHFYLSLRMFARLSHIIFFTAK